MKQKKTPKLTERQAWRIIESLFSERYGICHAVRMLLVADVIDDTVVDKMLARIKRRARADGKTSGSYIWPLVPGTDCERAHFAAKTARRCRRG